MFSNKPISTFQCLMVPWCYKNEYLNETFYNTIYTVTVITTTATNTKDKQN